LERSPEGKEVAAILVECGVRKKSIGLRSTREAYSEEDYHWKGVSEKELTDGCHSEE
jgi:hypothetical protein